MRVVLDTPPKTPLFVCAGSSREIDKSCEPLLFLQNKHPRRYNKGEKAAFILENCGVHCFLIVPWLLYIFMKTHISA